MIIKQLYESLVNSLNEARIQRTIDKKLWLTVASICSRNKSTEAEFIKPLSKMTKDEILQRYVAALLIMKKSCPETEQDIEKIKTFKLFGQKFISLNGTIDDIKKLYLENGGSGVSITSTINNVNIEKQKLETDIKKPIEQQVEQTEIPNKEDILNDEDIDELPDGINTYDQIFKYVNKKYTDIQEIYKQIYEILQTTYFTIQKTFYKIQLDKDNTLYFNTIEIDDIKRIYARNTKEILISWLKLNIKKVRQKEEGKLSIIINNMFVNNKKLSQNIELSDNITISLDNFMELSKIILSKLLYIKQNEYENPISKTKIKPKEIKTPFGSFDNKPIDVNKPLNKTIYNKILLKVKKQYNSYNNLINVLKYLFQYSLGNKNNGSSFELPYYYKTINAGNDGPSDSSKQISINGLSIFGNHIKLNCKFKAYNKITKMHLDVYYYMSNDWNPAIYSYGKKDEEIPYTNKTLMKELLQETLVLLLYYSNNYDEFIKG